MYLIKWPVRQKCTEALTSAGTVKCVAWVMLVKEKKKVNPSAVLPHWTSPFFQPAFYVALSSCTLDTDPSGVFQLLVLNSAVCPAIQAATISTDHITFPPASTHTQVLFPHNRCWSAPICMLVCTVEKKKVFGHLHFYSIPINFTVYLLEKLFLCF